MWGDTVQVLYLLSPPPYPTLPAGSLAPALVNVTSEGATQLRASWVHAPGGRDGYRVTLYQAGVPVYSSPVGAQVDGASFSALTPGTEYEVEVVTQAGPFRAVAASVARGTREWAWGRGRAGRWAGSPGAPPSGRRRPQPLVPPAASGPACGQTLPALLPQPQWCLRSCWCPCGRAAPWSAWPGPAAPGARSLPHAARGGRAPVPGAAPGPGPSPPRPEGRHAWTQPLLGRAVPGGAPPGLHAPCAAARGCAGACCGPGHPER